MGLFREDWKELTESRNAGSLYLTHLIRGRSDEEAYNTLLKILEKGFLRASFSRRNNCDTVKGNQKVVCFQDASFDAMQEILTGERWLGYETGYREFGIQVHKEIMFRDGARPVIYDKANEIMGLIDESIYWRVVNLDLENPGWMYTDWTHEHEWRITENVSLKKYPFYIIVKSNVYKEILLNEPKVQEAIKHTRGIIVFENEVSKNIELS